MNFNFFSKHKKQENKMNETSTNAANSGNTNPNSNPEKKDSIETKGGKTRIYNLIILDESGSMSCIQNAAISGFNETVGGIRSAQEKYADTQEHFVSLLTFCACKKKMLYDKVPVCDVQTLTTKEYRPCCGTPLYDAMGMALNKLYDEIKDMEDATAVVTIITDGMENASREYSGNAIKALVERLSNEEGWTFAYMGTNQDVEQVSKTLSISNHLFFQDNEEDMKRAWMSERNAKMRHFDLLNDSFADDMCLSQKERKEARSKMNRESKFFFGYEDCIDRITPANITSLEQNEIFVFGSDKSGTHNGGAAAQAVAQFGAIIGNGEGFQGQSYAIPTTGCSPLETRAAIERFILFAKNHPELKFLVTMIGCGNAGYSTEEMAHNFIYASHCRNICLPVEFWKYIM